MFFIFYIISDTSIKSKNKLNNLINEDEINNNNLNINDEEQEFIQIMNNIPLQLLGDTEPVNLNSIYSTESIITTKKLKCYSFKNDEYHIISPNVCINICNNDPCVITKQGTYTRSKVFDIKFPFYMNIPLFYCSTHLCYFSLITFLHKYQETINQVITYVNEDKISIIIFDQSIVVGYS